MVIKGFEKRELRKKSGVYKIVNIVNGKIYVGSAVDIAQRFRNHESDLEKGEHHSKYLQRSYIKYGGNNFVFEIIEFVEKLSQIDIEEFKILLLEREQYYLDTLIPVYNSYKNAGSSLGFKHDKKFRDDVSKRMKGVKKTEEHKKKISDSNKKAFSIPEECFFYGKSHTEETKEKMSKWQKKQVMQINKDNDEVIHIFDSVKEASEKTGILKTSISAVANCSVYKRKNSNGFRRRFLAGGFKWKYVEDLNEPGASKKERAEKYKKQIKNNMIENDKTS